MCAGVISSPLASRYPRTTLLQPIYNKNVVTNPDSCPRSDPLNQKPCRWSPGVCMFNKLPWGSLDAGGLVFVTRGWTPLRGKPSGNQLCSPGGSVASWLVRPPASLCHPAIMHRAST